jgi:hypothetical protein
VLEQNLLDLARIDVRAAGDDHVLGTVLQRQIAVGVEGAEVAGVQEAALERGRARLGVPPIARHDDIAADENLAGLARRQRPVLIVGHDHFDEAYGRPADASRSSQRGWPRARDVLARQGRDRHRGFAEAIDLREPRARSGRAPSARPRHTSARRPR